MYYAFYKHDCIKKGTLRDVAIYLKNKENNDLEPVIIISFDTGIQLDLDLSGSLLEIEQRFSEHDNKNLKVESQAPTAPKRGRPKLGVVGREVTLLPRHWEWLDSQRGGASASLRKLIDQARREHSRADAVRLAQDRSNRFLSAIAGDLPDYEDVTRALYAGNETDYRNLIKIWPKDVRHCAWEFAKDAF
ncbi:MAG: DUF2239 family protein [Agarilytica sp.]